MGKTTDKPLIEIEHWPPYWLSELDDAIAGGDYQKAGMATKRLRELGYDVRVVLSNRSEQREATHA